MSFFWCIKIVLMRFINTKKFRPIFYFSQKHFSQPMIRLRATLMPVLSLVKLNLINLFTLITRIYVLLLEYRKH